MAYWLFKSEPDSFSFDDLLHATGQETGWDGVRNYQARNLLRDTIAVGDQVLYYHSSADPLAIVGLATVVHAGHPDPSAFDAGSRYYDPKSDPANPTWYQVTIRAVRAFDPPILLSQLKTMPVLKDMMLLRRGSRLSVQPVTDDEFRAIVELAPPPRTTRKRGKPSHGSH